MFYVFVRGISYENMAFFRFLWAFVTDSFIEFPIRLSALILRNLLFLQVIYIHKFFNISYTHIINIWFRFYFLIGWSSSSILLSLFDVYFVYSTHISLSLFDFNSRENRNSCFSKNIYYALDDLIVVIWRLFHYRYFALDLLSLFNVYLIIVIRF